MRVDFDQMPPDARLWIFAAERTLSDAEQRHVLRAVDAFLDEWRAHGAPLTSARDLRYGQFLMIAVDESTAGASGCSIDAMTRVLGGVERELGVELANHAPVLYREGGGIARVDRPTFGARARQGEVLPDTIVFNNALTRVGELRDGRWEVPASASWHGRAFFRLERAGG